MTRRISQNLRFLAVATAIVLSACAGADGTDNDTAQDSAGSDGQAADVSLLTCKGDADCAPLASPCEIASCGADGYCAVTTLADSAACDDGDPCTSDTACSNGTCVGKYTCECKTDADCATQEDGNLRNGTLYCDTTGATPKCAPNPSTIVTCDSSLDTDCEKNVCDPKTGACVKLALQNGTPCDDGEACTGPDACKGGNCTGPSSCECQKEEDCAQFDDANPCNGTLYCDVTEFACKPLLRFLDFAISAFHGCAVLGQEDVQTGALNSTGKLYCWGLNHSALKNLGTASTAVSVLEPRENVYFGAAGQPFAKHVAVGYQTSCVIASDDKLHCFGVNTQGSLGTATDGTVPPTSQPTQPIGLPTVESVVIGDRAVCAMTTESGQGQNDRKVYCWGKRYGGQSGGGTHFATLPQTRTLP